MLASNVTCKGANYSRSRYSSWDMYHQIATTDREPEGCSGRPLLRDRHELRDFLFCVLTTVVSLQDLLTF